MNFHYDPILGLQYSSGFEIFEIDLDAIPVQDFSIKDWIDNVSKMGVQFLENTNPITNVFNRITSNVLL